MYNRFSTTTEVRRAARPTFEASEWDKMSFLQGIAATLEFKIPKRPIRETMKGLPAFTTVRGGAYFFLPGVRVLKWLAAQGC
jgi:hypothetical protein